MSWKVWKGKSSSQKQSTIVVEDKKDNSSDQKKVKKIGNNVFTFEDVCTSPYPTLRLRLNPPKEEKTSYWNQLFYKVSDLLQLNENPDQAHSTDYEKRIRKVFQDIKQMVDKTQEDVVQSLQTMTPDMQEIVVQYWEMANTFLGEVLDWLYEGFCHVVEKLKQGYRLNRAVLRQMLQQAISDIKRINAVEYSDMKNLVKGAEIKQSESCLPDENQHYTETPNIPFDSTQDLIKKHNDDRMPGIHSEQKHQSFN
jgi:hypothetical protein